MSDETLFLDSLREEKQTGSCTPTPSGLCEYIYELVSPVINPKQGLDPCAGLDNRLSEDWKGCQWHNYEIRKGLDFFRCPAGKHDDTDLVICNPPFGGLRPTRFVRQIVRVTTPSTPTIIILPTRSAADWELVESIKPRISAVIMLDVWAFITAAYPATVFMLNIEGLPPINMLPRKYRGW